MKLKWMVGPTTARRDTQNAHIFLVPCCSETSPPLHPITGASWHFQTNVKWHQPQKEMRHNQRTKWELLLFFSSTQTLIAARNDSQRYSTVLTKKKNCIHSLHVKEEPIKICIFLGMVNHPLRNWCSGRSKLFVATSWWSSNGSQLLSCCLIGVTSWGQDREKSPCHYKAAVDCGLS